MLYCGLSWENWTYEEESRPGLLCRFSVHTCRGKPLVGLALPLSSGTTRCPRPMCLLWIRSRTVSLGDCSHLCHHPTTCVAPLPFWALAPHWLCLSPEGAISLGFRLQSRLRWGQGGACGYSTAVSILLVVVLIIILLRLRCVCQETPSR